MNKLKVPPAPLYRDPIYDSPTDPVVIYNNVMHRFGFPISG